jgi:hypothetical protein
MVKLYIWMSLVSVEQAIIYFFWYKSPKEWRGLELVNGTKNTVDSERRQLGNRIVMFSGAMATDSTLKKWPLRPIFNLTACPSSSAARESIFVANSFDLLGNWRVMTEIINVSNVRAVDRTLERNLPLLSLLRVVMHSSCQRGGGYGKTDGKIKVMGKDRRSEEGNLWTKWRLLAPLNHKFPKRHIEV